MSKHSCNSGVGAELACGPVGAYARYVGRVGVLAVALGIGAAVAVPAIGWAETGAGTTVSGPAQSGDTPAAPQDNDDKPSDAPAENSATAAELDDPVTGDDDPVIGDDDLEDSAEVDLPDDIVDEDDSIDESDPPAPKDDVVDGVVEEPGTTVSTDNEIPTAFAISDSNDTGMPRLPAVIQDKKLVPPDERVDQVVIGDPPTARMLSTAVEETLLTSNVMRANLITTFDVPPPAEQPKQSIADALLAIPGTLVSGLLNAVSNLLAPLIGPGAPLDTPSLWGALLLVRRQFDQSFANHTPAANPEQTGQDIDDGQVHGLLGGSDRDGDSLTYTVPVRGAVGGPAHGAVTIDAAAGTWTYTPDNNGTPTDYTDDYRGSDSFTLTVSDGGNGSHLHGFGQVHQAIATAYVQATTTQVQPPIPPDPQNAYTAAPAEPGDPAGTVRGTVNATDPQGLPISYTHAGPATAEDGSTIVVNPDGSFVYSPSDEARHEAAAGADTFAFNVIATNSAGAATPIIVTVPVGPPLNQNPAVSPTSAPPVIGDHNTGTTTGEVGYTDPDGDTLTYTGPVGGHTAGGGTVTVNADGTYTYVPAPGQRHPASADDASQTGAATDTFAVEIIDGHGFTQVVTVTVPIDPRNVAPLPPAVGPGVTVDHADGAVAGSLGYTDPDGDVLTYTGPAGGQTSGGGMVTVNADGSYTYTPDPQHRLNAYNSVGTDTDSFDVVVSDGHGSTQTVTVHVTIDPARAAVIAKIDLTTGWNTFSSDIAVPGPNSPVYAITATADSEGVLTWHVTIVDSAGHVTQVPMDGHPIDRQHSGESAGLITAPNGQVYQTMVNTDGSFAVLVINQNGTVVKIPLTGTPAYGVLVGTDSRAYVLTTPIPLNPSGTPLAPLTVAVINPDNSYSYVSTGLEGSIYEQSPGDWRGFSPFHIATGPGGYAYLSGYTFSDWTGSVMIFHPDGTVTSTALPADASQAGNVFIGADGLVYQVIWRQSVSTSVVRINNDGTLTTIGNVPLVSPWPDSSVVAPDGTVYTVVGQQDGTSAIAAVRPGEPSVVFGVGDYYSVYLLAGDDGRVTALTFDAAGWTLTRYNLDQTPAVSVDAGDVTIFQPPGSDLVDRLFGTADGRAFAVDVHASAEGFAVSTITLINADDTVQTIELAGVVRDEPAFDQDGRIYFDFWGEIRGVVVIDPDGTLTTVPVNGDPRGAVRIGADGKAYISVDVYSGGSQAHVISFADAPSPAI